MTLFYGRDFLRKCDLQVDFRRNVMLYMDIEVPMRPRNYFDDPWRLNEALRPDKLFDDFDALATSIDRAKYDYVSTDDIAMAQSHLDNSQRDQLATMLRKFQKLFDGRLKTNPHGKVHLDLMPGAVPKHQRLAQKHLDVFKDELQRLCEIGVL